MTLEERLRERILREGPISFYEWMDAALYDKREGYYCADRQRQGRAGDYRTAPETSPLFAQTFAAYFAKLFGELGSPTEYTIIEVGGGSGEFAYGVLESLRSEHPKVFRATRYVINEISATSRGRCGARLSEFSDRVEVSSPTVREGKAISGIVFSNELIDAFPVNRVVMRNGQLRQLYVGIDDSRFVWIEGDLEPAVAEYCQRIKLNLHQHRIAEINLDAEKFILSAAQLLKHGYIVTVDYGAHRADLLTSFDREQGTLRAFRRHQFADDVLATPGEQDLTTTVDWTQIIEAGERAGLQTVRFERLDQFLLSEELLDRIAQIPGSTADPAEITRLTTSARDLIMPTGMGASFQVLVQNR